MNPRYTKEQAIIEVTKLVQKFKDEFDDIQNLKHIEKAFKEKLHLVSNLIKSWTNMNQYNAYIKSDFGGFGVINCEEGEELYIRFEI